MQIRIDEGYQREIDPLTPEEYNALEESILEYGCRDAIVLWGDTIVDGHNRYEICTSHDVPLRTMHMDFDSRDHALLWINNNQDARRNQTQAQRIDRQLRKKEILERIGRALKSEAVTRRHEENRSVELSMFDKSMDEESEVEVEEVIPHNTQKQMAEAAGVSTGTIAMAEIAKRDAPEVWQMAKDGKASINESFKAAKLEPEDRAEVVRQVEKGVSRTISEAIKKVVHVTQNTGNNEWYTPSEYIEAAREVMGGIDLDPASSEIANRNVKATRCYTEEDNGLEQVWAGRVWMNPPYAQPLMGQFAKKLAEECASGRVTEAVVLVNNATETQWCTDLVSVSTAVCFPKGRIRFWAPGGGDKSAPLQGQAVFYAGNNPSNFIERFVEFGWCAEVRNGQF
jgi:ParB family chromosome partitioning protein